ncbi:hypothetical protein C8R48DRAFT_704525 [Suillus tomentosus]|nr:hypothetical protein C8R48DRAFT_704525 [Suillus tomentosus]
MLWPFSLLAAVRQKQVCAHIILGLGLEHRHAITMMRRCHLSKRLSLVHNGRVQGHHVLRATTCPRSSTNEPLQDTSNHHHDSGLTYT